MRLRLARSTIGGRVRLRLATGAHRRRPRVPGGRWAMVRPADLVWLLGARPIRTGARICAPAMRPATVHLHLLFPPAADPAGQSRSTPGLPPLARMERVVERLRERAGGPAALPPPLASPALTTATVAPPSRAGRHAAPARTITHVERVMLAPSTPTPTSEPRTPATAGTSQPAPAAPAAFRSLDLAANAMPQALRPADVGRIADSVMRMIDQRQLAARERFGGR